MGRLVAIVAGCLLAVSLVAPASGRPNNREVTKEYSMAQGAIVYDSAEAHWTIGTQYQVFRPMPGERFLSLSISDDAGLSVRGHVHIHRHGKLDHADGFCDKTPKPISLKGVNKVEVGVILGTCPGEATPSLVTQGTITATFSK